MTGRQEELTTPTVEDAQKFVPITYSYRYVTCMHGWMQCTNSLGNCLLSSTISNK